MRAHPLLMVTVKRPLIILHSLKDHSAEVIVWCLTRLSSGVTLVDTVCCLLHLLQQSACTCRKSVRGHMMSVWSKQSCGETYRFSFFLSPPLSLTDHMRYSSRVITARERLSRGSTSQVVAGKTTVLHRSERDAVMVDMFHPTVNYKWFGKLETGTCWTVHTLFWLEGEVHVSWTKKYNTASLCAGSHSIYMLK